MLCSGCDNIRGAADLLSARHITSKQKGNTAGRKLGANGHLVI